MEKGLIIRSNKRENPYAMIDKYGLEDERLSWKAKGLLAYLLSKPDDWKIYVTELANHAKDKKDSIRAGIKELTECGYISMTRIRDEKNRFKGVQYVVYERPVSITPQTHFPYTENPHAEKPDTGKPYTENPPLLSNDLTNNDLTKIDRLIGPADAGLLSTESVEDPILKTLYHEGMEVIISDGVKGVFGMYQLGSNPGDIEKIYAGLVKKYPNQLDPEVIKIACRLFCENFYVSREKKSDYQIGNPVGWFLYNYGEAIVQYKAIVKKKELEKSYGTGRPF